mmetsp:Transcript_41351/g.86371  ORF Transcript_41351/g.86371 Transcript_41351/m.86371 type:complete len:81 (-) Transcript_41351:184-426(-)
MGRMRRERQALELCILRQKEPPFNSLPLHNTDRDTNAPEEFLKLQDSVLPTLQQGLPPLLELERALCGARRGQSSSSWKG